MRVFSHLPGSTMGAIGNVPDHVSYEHLDGEIVLLDLNTGNYYCLNESASLMWSLLLECEDLERVWEMLIQQYDADESQLRSDLMAFVEKLADSGLMELRNGSRPAHT